MGEPSRRVFIISDLHIGGDWPTGEDRGFRMMTEPERLAEMIEEVAKRKHSELVINGDFLDFLAEEHETPARWEPFLADPERAVKTLGRMVDRKRDALVFDALRKVVASDNRLTILLGNHDVELALPEVRAALAKRLGAEEGRRFRFYYDGEAYEPASNVLIEHGNRYDPANQVNHDGLRRLRSLQSRRQLEYTAGVYEPPAGSKLVAEVMNPLKSVFGFVDLLKPESEPLFALVLALEPEMRSTIGKLAKILVATRKHGTSEAALPAFQGDISSTEDDAALAEVLGVVLARNGAAIRGAADARPLDDAAYARDIGARDWVESKWGLFRLLLNGKTASVMERLAMVRQALRALNEDRTFDTNIEIATRYKDAAEELSRKPDGSLRYDYVVFGHTHHARQVKLDSGARYLNSGTWANLMRFPPEILGTGEVADDALWKFFDDLRENRLAGHIWFNPTYISVDIADGRAVGGELRTYDGALAD